MRTFVLAISSVLLLSMNADAALTGIQKCRSYVAKVEMDYAKCLKKGVVLQEKGKSSDVSKCDRKRDIGILKAEALYVAKQGVDSDACGLDDTSLSISKALMLVAAGEDPADYGISAEVLAGTVLDATSDNAAVAEAACEAAGGAWVSAACTAADITSDNAALCNDAGGAYDSVSDSCSVDITLDNAALCNDAGGAYDSVSDSCSVDITSDNAAVAEATCNNAGGAYDSVSDSCSVDNQGSCEAANGTWNSGTCTPGPGRNCFRVGACGVEGFNYGDWAGQDMVTSGCDVGENLNFYNQGLNHGAAMGGLTVALFPCSMQSCQTCSGGLEPIGALRNLYESLCE